MFIDEVQAMQERREPLKALTGSTSAAEQEEMQQQLMLLDASCPRYDVYNVYSVLLPQMIASTDPFAQKRNSEVVEKRQSLLRIAAKAPLGPPWFTFCLEHRCTDQQRVAYLVRWDKEQRRYLCTVMFDSVQTRGMVEFLPNAFELRLDEDDMFGGFRSDRALSGANLECAERAAELVRTCIELLNWDREDVPTQTLLNPKAKNSAKAADRTKKSAPTIIKFEPFLKQIREGIHRGSAGGHASPGQHLVKGHYKNFKVDKPLFGHKPVLGKTYGRLWVRPCTRGSAERGLAGTPRAVFNLSGIETLTA